MADDRKPLFLQGAMGGQQDFGSGLANNPLFMLGLNMIGGSVEGGPTGFGRGIQRGGVAMQQAAQRKQAMDVQNQRLGMARQRHNAAMGAHGRSQEDQGLLLQRLIDSGVDPKRAQLMATLSPGDATKMALKTDLAPHGGQELTALQRNYQLAKSQGFDGGFLDYQLALKKAGATNVNVGAGEKKYDQELGQSLAKTFVESQQEGAKASSNLAQISVLEKALSNPAVYTGTAGGAVNSLKKAAQSLLGVNVEGVADAEVIENTTNRMALAFKDELPGPMSDSDRRFLLELPPGLRSSPEGARRLTALYRMQNEWKQRQAQAIRSYAENNGGRLDAGIYTHLGNLNNDYQKRMGALVGELRNQKQASPRSALSGVSLRNYNAAKSAIARGGDRNAILNALREAGIPTEGL